MVTTAPWNHGQFGARSDTVGCQWAWAAGRTSPSPSADTVGRLAMTAECLVPCPDRSPGNPGRIGPSPTHGWKMAFCSSANAAPRCSPRSTQPQQTMMVRCPPLRMPLCLPLQGSLSGPPRHLSSASQMAPRIQRRLGRASQSVKQFSFQDGCCAA